MSSIAALVHSAQLREELSLLPSSRGTIQLCAGEPELYAAMHGEADTALLELHDGNSSVLPSVVRELRAEHLGATILVYCSPGLSVSSAILSVASAGANALFLQGFDELEPALCTALGADSPASALAWVVRSMTPIVPPDVADVMHCVAADPRRAPTVHGVCATLHTNRRTLSYRLRRCGYPPPHTIVGWTRILGAARLLEYTGESVEKVAASLRFRSGVAMRSLFLRLTGRPPSAARRSGGYELMLETFLESCAAPRSK